MNKQELARKRNWFKFRLMGSVLSIDVKYLTKKEVKILTMINSLKTQLLDEFNSNSKALGLYVPEHRCTYCRREAKYHVGGLKTGGFSNATVCYKHWKEYSSDEEPLLILNK